MIIAKDILTLAFFSFYSFTSPTTKNLQDPLFHGMEASPVYSYEFLYDKLEAYDLAFITHRYHRLKMKGFRVVGNTIKNLYTAIVIDSKQQKAYKIEFLQITTLQRNSSSDKPQRSKKELHTKQFKLSFREVIHDFELADSLKFHQLDHQKLNNTCGPIQSDGSQLCYDITDVRAEEIGLKANGKYKSIRSFQPDFFHQKFPEINQDRYNFIQVRNIFKKYLSGS